MRKKNLPRRLWRQLCQVSTLLLFFTLFIKTDYSGQDEIAYAVNIFFRLDPLLATATALAGRTIIGLMLPALLTVGLSLLFGRAFCGWFCPLGTLLDFSHRFLKPRQKPVSNPWISRSTKFYLLFFILAGAFFGLPLVGILDPFSLLVRGLSLTLYPALNLASTSLFTFTYQQAPEWVNAVSEPLYSGLKYAVLPFHQKYYDLALLSLTMLVLVFLLELLERRFFCKKICPLGALLAVLANFSRLRGHGGNNCANCTTCQDICRMEAIDLNRKISAHECNLCLDCLDACPGNKISFHWSGPKTENSAFDLSRRALLGSVIGGVTLPLFLQTRTLAQQPDPLLIRPPGALAEKEFLTTCVRCGECMQVCIGNAIQPTFLEAGLEGIFSPKLKMRTGYCEYHCTLCGQVCPTGAIRKLSQEKKIEEVIGRAHFDKNLCLPFAKATPCIVCEEHCPTADKAIKFRIASVLNEEGYPLKIKQPYVIDRLCIGCGICENRCPLPGTAAIRVTSAGASRSTTNSFPCEYATPY